MILRSLTWVSREVRVATFLMKRIDWAWSVVNITISGNQFLWNTQLFSCWVVPNSLQPPWTTAYQGSPVHGIFQARMLDCHFLLQKYPIGILIDKSAGQLSGLDQNRIFRIILWKWYVNLWGCHSGIADEVKKLRSEEPWVHGDLRGQ